AAAACGLQNAMVTTYSGAIIRTTHLTGIISDLGASVGHWLAGKEHSKKKILIQSMLVSGFFCGGMVGTVLYTAFKYTALLFPAGIIFITGAAYITLSQVKIYRKNRQVHIADQVSG
ncbi:MAG: YoaK family protein, partial [Enterovibrio sp.]